jgi:signal transduction histidine kinase
MAGTLRRIIEREPLPGDWRDDTRSGLDIIHDRAESLGRFMGAYARLARLPRPALRLAELAPLVRRAASRHGTCVTVKAGLDIHLDIDADQIEQVLINLIKNAVEGTTEAAREGGGVRVGWRVASGAPQVEIEIEDDGPGLGPTDNLWVPFFTTKPGGTGIGLVLSREIVENHGGTISLENKRDGRGCIARVTLPR